MKVILLENVPSLGPAGTVVEVARGYARNFLIPQGKAQEATPANLARFEAQRARLSQLAEKERAAARELAARLAEVVLTIPQRVGEAERLYGSVTSSMIAEALAEKGFQVDRKQIELEEPIKKLGTYEVTVRLGPEVKGRFQVEVVPEKA
uniref:Large ribosomal subunit protein bL9 n=1 Tax=Desulfobacca acetoxidans TaxID=60893 RepID=A0A7V6A3S2_9BACT